MQPEVFDAIAGKHVHFILHSVPSQSTRGPFRRDSFKPDDRITWLLASVSVCHDVNSLELHFLASVTVNQSLRALTHPGPWSTFLVCNYRFHDHAAPATPRVALANAPLPSRHVGSKSQKYVFCFVDPQAICYRRKQPSAMSFPPLLLPSLVHYLCVSQFLIQPCTI